MFGAEILEALLNTAHRARKGKLPDGTDAYRIFDGGGDGREGVFVDTFAGHWLVSFRDRAPREILSSRLPRESVWFKRLDQDNKLAPTCAEGDPERAAFTVREGGMHYHIDFGAGYSQGIFLDQRDNRALVTRRSAGLRVLNCFSYTCAFSVAAAAGGAESTTSIDLSRPYLDWGKRNFELNGVDPDEGEHYFCRGDVFDWLGQFRRKGRLFGGVVLDPPTFSRSKGRGVFRVEKDYAALAEAAARLVGEGGWLLATCNQRGLSGRRFASFVRDGVRAAGRRVAALEDRPMPPDFTGEPYLKSVLVDL